MEKSFQVQQNQKEIRGNINGGLQIKERFQSTRIVTKN